MNGLFLSGAAFVVGCWIEWIRKFGSEGVVGWVPKHGRDMVSEE